MQKAPWPGTKGGYQPGRVADEMIARANAWFMKNPKRQEHYAGDGKTVHPVKK